MLFDPPGSRLGPEAIQPGEVGAARAERWRLRGSNVADSGGRVFLRRLQCALWREPASLWQSDRAMSRHIAIVEDEPAIRANYADAFTRHGYRVSTYGSRRDATLAFRQRLPELVIIDVGLGEESEGGF